LRLIIFLGEGEREGRSQRTHSPYEMQSLWLFPGKWGFLAFLLLPPSPTQLTVTERTGTRWDTFSRLLCWECGTLSVHA